MTKQERIQTDEDIKNHIIKFTKEFSIEDSLEFVIAFNLFRIDSEMSNEVFFNKLAIVKKAFEVRLDNKIYGKYIKDYITVVDRMLNLKKK